jgi:hypothetical protein
VAFVLATRKPIVVVVKSISRKAEEDKARLAIIRCCGKRRCTSNSLRPLTNSSTLESRVNTTATSFRNYSRVINYVTATPTQVQNAADFAVNETAAQETETTASEITGLF